MKLEAQAREATGRKTEGLRAEGIVPAVVYGLDKDAMNIQVARNEFDRVFKDAGESTVIELSIDGAVEPVLVQEIQRDALTDFTTHIDFRRVDMNVKVDASIRLVMVGVAPAVKELGGTLVQSLDELEVMALPSALVSEIEVDATVLKTFDDAIHVSDLTIPEGIEVMTDPERTIATISAPRVEEEPVDGGSADMPVTGSDEAEAANAESSENAE